jgi:hypothetical protein
MYSSSLHNNFQQQQQLYSIVISKYSPSCSKIFKMVDFISPHINMRVIDIDNPSIRKLVVESGKAKTVPCVIIVSPNENKIDFYEGSQCLQLLQQLTEYIQDKIRLLSQSQQPSRSNVEEILSREVQTEQPRNNEEEIPTATMSGRNDTKPIPEEIPMGHEELQLSTIPNAPRGVLEPSEIEGGVLIDDSIYESQNEETVGMSKSEILGDNQGFMDREKEKKSKLTHSKMEQMMKQRDEMDSMLVDPRKKLYQS